MFTRRIRFDRVVGRRRIVRGRSVTTAFGFEADGRQVVEARVHGDHEVPVGVDLTVALRHEDAWTTLLGWVDHSSGRMVCGRPSTAILLALLSVVPLVVFAQLAVAAMGDAPTAHHGRELFLCAMALAALGVTALMIREARFTLQARRFLAHTLARSDPPAA